MAQRGENIALRRARDRQDRLVSLQVAPSAGDSLHLDHGARPDWTNIRIGLVLWCYVGGNYVSMIFDDRRWRQIVQAIEGSQVLMATAQDPLRILSVDYIQEVRRTIGPVLQLDRIAATYVGISALLIIMSYVWAGRRSDKLHAAGVLVALPAVILLVLGGAGAVLYGLVAILNIGIVILSLLFGVEASVTQTLVEIVLTSLPLVAGLTICAVYYAACQGAVQNSRLVVEAWRSGPRRLTGQS